MRTAYHKFYINGEWVEPSGRTICDVINPANEEVVASIALGTKEDVDAAVTAARTAFPSWSQSSVKQRIAVIEEIIAGMEARSDELAAALTVEMGAPKKLASTGQIRSGLGHFRTIVKILRDYEFEEVRGTTRIIKEPAGVCGFITPWNWPLNQIACKVAPAIAAGCTMVLKPSEVAPLSGYILSEIIANSSLPAGVYNMVNGDGPCVGSAISSHPGIDVVSFTGSTRAGQEVGKAAAATIKRVTLELGGKSANIILDDTTDFASEVRGGVARCFINSGQSCNAPSRMLVPKDRMAEAVEAAKIAVAEVVVGDPSGDEATHGPVVSASQYERIQKLIEMGIEEGAELVTGGLGRPEGLTKGYYVKPTVLANVNNTMTVAREEVFGPVLCILPYEDDDDAVAIANDTDYGLSGYVSGEPGHARAIARRLRTGMVHINGAAGDFNSPFGGYKTSGNGREWGREGFEEFLETKSVLGSELK